MRVVGVIKRRPGWESEPMTPRIYRKARGLEIRGKRRSKALNRHFRNYFGHFIAQTNVEVTRGHQGQILYDSFGRAGGVGLESLSLVPNGQNSWVCPWGGGAR